MVQMFFNHNSIIVKTRSIVTKTDNIISLQVKIWGLEFLKCINTIHHFDFDFDFFIWNYKESDS